MREAQLRCSPSEYAEWQALYRLDPWGEERADMRIGQVVALLANALRGKGGRRYKATDFYLSDRRGLRKQTPQQMEAVMLSVMEEMKRG